MSAGSLHAAIISSILHPMHGGPPAVVRAHAAALSKLISVSVFGVAPRGSEECVRNFLPAAQLFPEAWPHRWLRGSGLAQALEDQGRSVDLFHAHNLWDYGVWISWRTAQRFNKPLIITPHGSLITLWRQSAVQKRLYRRLVLDRIIAQTACFHVLNPAEERACREYGVTCPIHVIPNGLPQESFLRSRKIEIALERWPELRNRRILLYMGRLWGDKGLDILPEAFAEARTGSGSDWLLVLAGPDYRNYKMELLSRIQCLRIEKDVLLTGFVDGDLKDALLDNAECFVLPSKSEAMSMAILEAMAAGIPSLYSQECNFPDLAATGGGWEITRTKDAFVDALDNVFRMTPEALCTKGQNAKNLGLRNYTMERVAAELLSMYRQAI